MDFRNLIEELFEKYAVLASEHQSVVIRPAYLNILYTETYKAVKAQGLDLGTFYYNLNDLYMNDLKTTLKQSTAHLQIAQDIKKLNIKDKNWWLLTIGFDDKGILGRESEILKKCHESILRTAGITFRSFAIEKHRKDEKGKEYIHHHIHYAITTNFPKSRVIDYIFQKVKKYVAAKNFVDLTQRAGSIEGAIKYCTGDKQEAKLPLIAKDKIWRKAENIPEN